MRVHINFKEWVDSIKESNKELTGIKITKLITRHKNSSSLKEDIKNYDE